MFENKVIESCCVVLLAGSVAYLGIRTIHEWDNVKHKKWDVARAAQVQQEYNQSEVK